MLRIGHCIFFISDLTCEKCKFIPYGMAVQLLPVNNRYIFVLKQYKVPAINPSHFYLLLGGSRTSILIGINLPLLPY